MRLNFIVWDGSNSSDPLNLDIETGSDHPPIAGQIFHWPAAGYFLIVDVPEPHIVIAKNVGFWSGPPILTKDGSTHLSFQDHYVHWNRNCLRIKDGYGIVHKMEPTATQLASQTKCWRDQWWSHGPMTETEQAINCLGCLYIAKSEKMHVDNISVNRRKSKNKKASP